MPRYLGQDFVAQVLSKKRQLLCRLLLASPDHLDKIGRYCHKGNIDVLYYSSPWKFIIGRDTEGLFEDVSVLDTSAETSTHCGGELWDELSSVISIRTNMDNLVCGILSIPTSERKVFAESLGSCSPDLIGSSRPQDELNDTMSLAIDMAIHEVTDQIEIGCYNFEQLDGKDEVTEGNCCLEAMLDRDFLHLGLCGLPSSLDLVRCLQPLPVQDPFVSGRGVPHSYHTVFGRDLKFSHSIDTTVVTWKDVLLPGEITSSRDPLLCGSDDETADGAGIPYLMEPSLCISLPLPVLPSTMIAVNEFSESDTNGDEDEKALWALYSTQGGEQLERLTLEDSDIDNCRKQQDFATLNHQSLSDSYDSGCQHMYMESPSTVSVDNAFSSRCDPVAGLEGFEELEPMPTSPELNMSKMYIIAPLEHKELILSVQNKESIFDDILAYLLPVPRCDEVCRNVPSVSGIILNLNLCSEDMDTEFEFTLSWDPLCYAIDAMNIVKSALQNSVFAGSAPHCMMEQECDNPAQTLSIIACTREELGGVDDSGEESYMSLFEEVTGVSCRRIPLASGNTSHRTADTVAPSTQQGRTGTILSEHLHNSNHDNRPHCSTTSMASLTTAAAKTKVTSVKKTENCSPSLDMSPLDLFMFMRNSGEERGGITSEERPRPIPPSGSDVCVRGEDAPSKHLIPDQEEPSSEKKSSGTRHVEDVTLTGLFLAAYEVVSHHGQMTVDRLNGLGVRLPSNFTQLTGETSKFYLRQQEKVVQTVTEPSSAGDLEESCHLCAMLVVLSTTAECLRETSFSVALNMFLDLSEKYSHHLRDALNTTCAELGKLHVTVNEQGVCHPKVDRLLSILVQWLRQQGNSSGSKSRSVVLIGGEFPTVSAEMMDVLNSVEGLSACVFSLTPQHQGDMHYLQEADARLHHYSCLLLPVSSFSELFPWERISLLVEYNLTASDNGGTVHGWAITDHASYLDRHASLLKKYKHIDVYTLKGAGSKNAPAVTGPRVTLRPGNVPYRFICSQAVTSNARLLQLLESRFNIITLERDYDRLKHTHSPGSPQAKPQQYADVVYDERCGAVLLPVNLLATPDGFKPTANRIMSLSLQFIKLWIILYNSEDGSYMYSGHVPLNIAKIHASVANFDVKKDGFMAKVLIANSLEEAAQVVRSIGESIHHNSEGWSSEEWPRRDWLTDELSAHERFLLHFPCLNAFSAQLMLTMCSLKELMAADALMLKQQCAILPEKYLKMFVSITHMTLLRKQTQVPTQASAPSRMPLHNRLRLMPENRKQDLVTNKMSAVPSTLLHGNHQVHVNQHLQRSHLLQDNLKLPTQLPSQHTEGVVPMVHTSVKGQPLRASLDELMSRHFQLPSRQQGGSGVSNSSSVSSQVVQSVGVEEQRGKRVKSVYHYSDSGVLQTSSGGKSGGWSLEEISRPSLPSAQSSAAPQNVVRSKFFTSTGSDSPVHEGGFKGLLEFGQRRKARAEKGTRVLSHFPSITSSAEALPVPTHFSRESSFPSIDRMNANSMQHPPHRTSVNVHNKGTNFNAEFSQEKGKDPGLLAAHTVSRKRQPVRCLELEDSKTGVQTPAGRKRDSTTPLSSKYSEKRFKPGEWTNQTLGCPSNKAGRQNLFDLHSFHVQQASGNHNYAQTASWKPSLDLGTSANSSGSIGHEEFQNGKMQPGVAKQSKWSHWLEDDSDQSTLSSLYTQKKWPPVSGTPPQTVPYSDRK